MDYSQTKEHFTVTYVATSQVVVGMYFAVLGILAIVIANFLISEDATLLVAMAGLFTLIGIAVAAFRPKIRTVITRAGGTITIHRSNLIKRIPSAVRIPIGEITKVEIASYLYGAGIMVNGDRSNNSGVVIYLHTKSGARIKIAAQQNRTPSFVSNRVTEAEIKAMGVKLAEFLKVPIDDDPNVWRPLET